MFGEDEIGMRDVSKLSKAGAKRQLVFPNTSPTNGSFECKRNELWRLILLAELLHNGQLPRP
jgi:hypothetical protein